MTTRGGDWYELRIHPYRDSSDRIAGVVVALIDVTDRKLAELEAERQRTYLDAVLEALPVAVMIADGDGRIVRANAATRELWGTHPETGSWKGYGDWVGWWPETGERIKAEEWALARALHSGEETRNELVQGQRFGSAERRTFLNNVSPIRDADGEITGAVAAMLDVTDRAPAEERPEEGADDDGRAGG